MPPNPRLTLESAAAAFLKDYGQRYAKNSLVATSAHIRRFLRDCPRTYVDELVKADLVKFLAQWQGDPRRFRATAVNSLLRWTGRHYHMAVPQADQDKCRWPILSPTQSLADAQQRMVAVCAASETLRFTHQRAVFLCGFLYLLPLQRLVHATLAELKSFHQRDDIYNLLVETARLSADSGGALFRPWLGTCVQTAQKHWKGWGTGLQFREIVKAGTYARVTNGICPQRGAARLSWALPSLDDQNIERLPRFWTRG